MLTGKRKLPIPGRVPQILRLARQCDMMFDETTILKTLVNPVKLIQIRLVVYLTVGAPNDPIGNETFLTTAERILQIIDMI